MIWSSVIELFIGGWQACFLSLEKVSPVNREMTPDEIFNHPKEEWNKRIFRFIQNNIPDGFCYTGVVVEWIDI